MNNSKLDWKGVGQFIAVLVQIWTIIKGVVDETKVGIEILGWIVEGDGRECFKRFLGELVAEHKNIIDFDSVPTIPRGLTIALDRYQIVSRVSGKRNLKDIKIRLHLDDGQTDGKVIMGNELREKLRGQEVYGAQLLDFYLEHPDLIPEDWKKKGYIFFWGTIYFDDRGYLYVRCLCWNGTRWVSFYFWLGSGWDGSDPAAVSASLQV